MPSGSAQKTQEKHTTSLLSFAGERMSTPPLIVRTEPPRATACNHVAKSRAERPLAAKGFITCHVVRLLLRVRRAMALFANPPGSRACCWETTRFFLSTSAPPAKPAHGFLPSLLVLRICSVRFLKLRMPGLGDGAGVDAIASAMATRLWPVMLLVVCDAAELRMPVTRRWRSRTDNREPAYRVLAVCFSPKSLRTRYDP